MWVSGTTDKNNFQPWEIMCTSNHIIFLNPALEVEGRWWKYPAFLAICGCNDTVGNMSFASGPMWTLHLCCGNNQTGAILVKSEVRECQELISVFNFLFLAEEWWPRAWLMGWYGAKMEQI